MTTTGTFGTPTVAPMPRSWRILILAAVAALALGAFTFREILGVRGQAAAGVLCFISFVAACSANLRSVNWRTIGWGFALQLLLALFVLKTEFGYQLFSTIGQAVGKFLQFSDAGAQFVFGVLADREAMEKYWPNRGVVFAFRALPPIIFVSSFFTVLYYFGVLQWIVRLMARAMIYLMRTSGAESLSAAANVFMGQTEAPLIVKPYVARMTQSELLALMVGGMATISGGIMAVYIEMGADKVAILATSVMAAPCGLYLSKLLLPELEEPETRGIVTTPTEQTHRNVIDAAASGASDGLYLALNVAAMLIAFLAILALIDYLLMNTDDALNALNGWLGSPYASEFRWNLSLQVIFSWVFAPLAFLMGVAGDQIPAVADLLGIKLAANEFVAYAKLTDLSEKGAGLVPGTRAYVLSTYALTGFANFASVGIQIGGIGVIAPSRRPDLARLGGRALFVGFTATLVNAAVAGIMLESP
jgi:CNT family concentrative nucleoside transporter